MKKNRFYSRKISEKLWIVYNEHLKFYEEFKDMFDAREKKNKLNRELSFRLDVEQKDDE